MPMTAKEKREARARAREAKAAAAKAAGEKTEVEQINEQAFRNPGSIAKPPEPASRRDGGTVTVALKLGVAFYDIYLCRRETVKEDTQTGPRDVTKFTPMRGPEDTVIRLRGTAYPRGTPPDGFPAPPIIVGGAAMNPGIPKRFWDTWVEQNKLSPLVQNGFIFAHEKTDHVEGRAKEETGKQSGLEPLDPRSGKDRRIPRSTNASVADVETESSRAAKFAQVR